MLAKAALPPKRVPYPRPGPHPGFAILKSSDQAGQNSFPERPGKLPQDSNVRRLVPLMVLSALPQRSREFPQDLSERAQTEGAVPPRSRHLWCSSLRARPWRLRHSHPLSAMCCRLLHSPPRFASARFRFPSPGALRLRSVTVLGNFFPFVSGPLCAEILSELWMEST